MHFGVKTCFIYNHTIKFLLHLHLQYVTITKNLGSVFMANSEASKKKRRKMIFTIISIVGIGAAIYFVIKILGNQDVQINADDWLKQKSNNEINTIREKARLKHCSGDENATRILEIIDNELRRRDNICRKSGESLNLPPREHGLNLYKDD